MCVFLCYTTIKTRTAGVGHWGDMRTGLQWFVGFVFILDLSIDFSLHVIYCTRLTHLKVSNLLCILKPVVTSAYMV